MIYPALTKVTLTEAGGLSTLGIAIVFAVLIVLMVILSFLTRMISGKKNNKSAQDTTQQTAAVPTAQTANAVTGPAIDSQAPGSAGVIKLNDVSEKQAAMVMAIVADHLKVPLNQLRFKSIKRVD